MDSGARRSNQAPRSASPDFRQSLYDRYVSGFKGTRGSTDGSFAWWDHKYLPLLADVDRTAPLLELGCGDGALLAYMERRGFLHARGVDIAPEQIELARVRSVDAEVADVFDVLPRQRGLLAAIVAVDFVEHFRRSELLRLAPLLFDALRPGGRLLIQTANGAGLLPGQVIYGDLTHMSILTPESIAQLLRPVGFDDIRCFETGPVPLRLRGKLDVAVWSAVRLVARTVKYVETGKRQDIWTENFICTTHKPGAAAPSIANVRGAADLSAVESRRRALEPTPPSGNIQTPRTPGWAVDPSTNESRLQAEEAPPRRGSPREDHER